MQDLLADAERESYAIGGFIVEDAGMLRAVVEAAHEEKSPVILQIGAWLFGKADVRWLCLTARAAANDARVPIAVHLDHGTTLDHIQTSIRLGLSAAMFDGSALPFDQNARTTADMVQRLHAAGLGAEGELGRIPGGDQELSDDDRAPLLTDPRFVKPFIQRTQVDCLAVAIGTAHGMYKHEPCLDFTRLKEIRAEASVPLVLHGGSNTPDDQVAEAIRLGIRKINIATDMRNAFDAAMKGPAEAADAGLARSPADRGRLAVKETVIAKMRLFGSSNKAYSTR